MVTLRADQRSLTKNRKFSYLSTNYASAQSSVVVANSTGFANNDYVLFGEFGAESSEIIKVSTVTSATHTLSLATNTKFAHPQDTKVTTLGYNQVRFYHTTTTTFSATDPVTGYVDLQPDSEYALAYDTTNTTGFGWFCFYNSTTAKITTNSNAIPYADFNEYAVTKIFDAFFSLLNNKERKLIDDEDAFRWLNEGYSIAQNELNLVNPEFGVAAEWTFTTTSGTQEYALPSNFGDLVSVTDGDGEAVGYITLSEVPNHDDNATATEVRYFLRGTYIGVSPLPTGTATYYIYYKAKTSKLSSYYDDIALPDNNFYPLVDFMMYRASIKLNRPDSQVHLQAFQNSMNRMKLVSHKQNANLDKWGMDNASCI